MFPRVLEAKRHHFLGFLGDEDHLTTMERLNQLILDFRNLPLFDARIQPPGHHPGILEWICVPNRSGMSKTDVSWP